MKSGIYCIENLINGKKYIGQGIDVEKRMNNCHSDTTAIYNALKKYTKENFKRKIILYCEINELELYEKACIKIFHSHKSEWGYNISWGGVAPMLGRNHTSEAKKSISINHPDYSGKNNPRYGVPVSKKTREQMSNSHREEKSIFFGIKKPNASSKYFGVTKYINKKNETKWRVRPSIHGKLISLGLYKTEIEAALAYDKYILENKLYIYPLNFPK